MLTSLLVLAASAPTFRLSNVFGDHMVLQRDTNVIVWGFGTVGAAVQARIGNAALNATVDATGVWRVTIGPTPAGGPYVFAATSQGTSVQISDVLFGDVLLCGGQSNMQFVISTNENATAEIASAALYPQVRLFTVGQGTSSNTPLAELATIEQGWTVASPAAVSGASFTKFSAVCWLWGKQLSDALNKIPIGLISNNWGGTAVQLWSSPAALKRCSTLLPAAPSDLPPAERAFHRGLNNTLDASTLYNAMIVPYILGPMSIKGISWYQGEANVGQAAYYACAFPVMIDDWRAGFGNPGLWFGFVQIAGYSGYAAGGASAELRAAQLAALSRPRVAFATAADCGFETDIHPQNKQIVSYRLLLASLAGIYGMNVAWQAPAAVSSYLVANGNGRVVVNVNVDSSNVGTGLTTTVPPFAVAVHSDKCVADATKCGYPTIIFTDGTEVAAALSLTGPNTISLSVTGIPAGARVWGTSYGWNAWPINLVWTSLSQPVLPWRAAIGNAM